MPDTQVLDPIEELNRKVNETLVATLEAYAMKGIGVDVVADRLRLLWDIAAGLVDRETMDGISEAISNTGLADRFRIEVWRNAANGKHVVVKIGLHPTNARLEVVADGNQAFAHDFSEELRPWEEMAAKYALIARGLIASGYTSLVRSWA